MKNTKWFVIGVVVLLIVFLNQGKKEASTQFTYSLNAGWNLISLPVIPSSTSPTIFDGCGTHSNNPMRECSPIGQCSSSDATIATQLQPRKAYWLFVMASTQCTISGTPILDTTPFSLVDGWNSIGTISNSPLYMSSLTGVTEMRIWTSPIFTNVDVIQPGQGASVYKQPQSTCPSTICSDNVIDYNEAISVLNQWVGG